MKTAQWRILDMIEEQVTAASKHMEIASALSFSNVGKLLIYYGDRTRAALVVTFDFQSGYYTLVIERPRDSADPQHIGEFFQRYEQRTEFFSVLNRELQALIRGTGGPT